MLPSSHHHSKSTQPGLLTVIMTRLAAHLESGACIVGGLRHGLALLVPALRLALRLLRVCKLHPQQLQLHLELPGAVHHRPGAGGGGGGGASLWWPLALLQLGLARIESHLKRGAGLLRLLKGLQGWGMCSEVWRGIGVTA